MRQISRPHLRVDDKGVYRFRYDLGGEDDPSVEVTLKNWGPEPEWAAYYWPPGEDEVLLHEEMDWDDVVEQAEGHLAADTLHALGLYGDDGWAPEEEARYNAAYEDAKGHWHDTNQTYEHVRVCHGHDCRRYLADARQRWAALNYVARMGVSM